jgi:2-oxoglutarate dehydrogenase E1 component
MANFLHDSILSGANIDFIEGLYARYLENPSSVEPSWREYFDGVKGPGKPIYRRATNGKNGSNGHAAAFSAPVVQLDASQTEMMGLQARVDQTIYAFRLRGHLLAQLDPLGRPRPGLSHNADLSMVNTRHFTEAELEQYVDPADVFPSSRVRLRDLMDRLRKTYCHHIGVEFMSLLNSDRRRWLMPRMEHTANTVEPSLEQEKRILTQLDYAVGFERFLHTKYVNAKRFSLDGGESLIPMLHAFLEEGGAMGMREVVIGMAHRGRLNVLTNILGKSPTQIFSEFEGPTDPKAYINRGDVKYHQGFSSDYVTGAGQKIHLSLAFNPSHLEAVDPVVIGRVRAKQDRFRDTERKRVVPLLIHGDAAIAGQGLVAETLNLSRLPAYDVGGTVHIVINNQVGFTTEPSEARSTIYCTAVTQMLDIPVFHVNGDDPEACVHAMQLATQYRQYFKSDVVIDLVCFRRYGHNEGDEPSFTQPQMYHLIKTHPTVPELYAKDLARRGRLSAEEANAISKKTMEEFQLAHARAKESNQFKEASAMEGLWKNYRGGLDKDVPQMDTGVPRAKLSELLMRLSQVPEGFTVHPTLAKSLIPHRKAMAEGNQPLDWAAGEALAYATLLTEGSNIRITGQDTERGTFSHRHAVLHDFKTDQTYRPFEMLAPSQGLFRIHNSPLSEMGCLGFEFGYSLDCPDSLVVWEAQFGDFVNNAQVIIDQFIVAAEKKWRRLCGLTLLLPHGYEGQGPEHSSARLERFLELCGDDNIQVCYPSAPAQIFHLLRRQVRRPIRKPLVIMSPKSLLRRPEAISSLDELADGRFMRVIGDKKEMELRSVTRLLLCSGKVYYDLFQERQKRKDTTVAIARVEQLYPFPEEELVALLSQMPKLSELIWVQEEPKNMGAWRYIFPLLHNLASFHVKNAMIGFVGRTEAASPATGFVQAHNLEQQMIVEQALTRGGKHGR